MISECSKSNPEGFHPNFRFSVKTANSTLQLHLESKHKDEYLCLHKARGWKTQLKSMKEADTESTPVSEAGSHVPFTPESLLAHLVELIVANDHVSTLHCHLYHADFSPLGDQRC